MRLENAALKAKLRLAAKRSELKGPELEQKLATQFEVPVKDVREALTSQSAARIEQAGEQLSDFLGDSPEGEIKRQSTTQLAIQTAQTIAQSSERPAVAVICALQTAHVISSEE